jgi:hypothetical protein
MAMIAFLVTSKADAGPNAAVAKMKHLKFEISPLLMLPRPDLGLLPASVP